MTDFEPYVPVQGTYAAPDITPTPTPVASDEDIPEVTIIPEEGITPMPEMTPVPEVTHIPEVTPEAEDTGSTADDFRVTPPPDISWGDGYDPTEDPQ